MGVAGKNHPIIVLEQVARLLDEQLLGTQQVSNVVGLGHNLEAAKVLSAGRRRPKTLHPRHRPKDGSCRSLAKSVRRHTGQLEMHPKTSMKPRRLQLPVPRRESEGKSSSLHDVGRRNLVTNPPAATPDEEVRWPVSMDREVVFCKQNTRRDSTAGLQQ
jgi:hypothetical protein